MSTVQQRQTWANDRHRLAGLELSLASPRLVSPRLASPRTRPYPFLISTIIHPSDHLTLCQVLSGGMQRQIIVLACVPPNSLSVLLYHSCNKTLSLFYKRVDCSFTPLCLIVSLLRTQHNSSTRFTSPWVSVPSAPIAIGITVTLMFYIFSVLLQGPGIFLSFHLPSILLSDIIIIIILLPIFPTVGLSLESNWQQVLSGVPESSQYSGR